MIIGLTGSIAMGKSEVAKIFKSQNIPVFDADATVHEIYQNGTAAKALANLCPQAIFKDKVDRKILAEMIAHDKSLLPKITALIHPLVYKAEAEFRQQHHDEMAIIDSPLILETGRARDMDMLIVVSSLPELQRARAMARPAMTAEKFELIKSKQMPDDEKRNWADYVIENNGTLVELEATTNALISEIKKELGSHA